MLIVFLEFLIPCYHYGHDFSFVFVLFSFLNYTRTDWSLLPSVDWQRIRFIHVFAFSVAQNGM